MNLEKPNLNLGEVSAQFQAWRKTKTSVQQRIPAELWRAAIKLLEYYPMGQVCRELHVSAQDINKQRAQMQTVFPTKVPSSNKQFMEVTGHPLLTVHSNEKPLSTPSQQSAQMGVCQILLEKKDGTRLSISLPG